jgi:hypothetical protein
MSARPSRSFMQRRGDPSAAATGLRSGSNRAIFVFLGLTETEVQD